MSEENYKLENIPEGTYDVEASKDGYIAEKVENVEVKKDATSTVDFKLKGGDNMGTYTKPLHVESGTEKIIAVPVIEPEVPVRFINAGLGNPLIGKQVELLSEDESTVLQTKTTDAEGLVVFGDVMQGNYKVRITY